MEDTVAEAAQGIRVSLHFNNIRTNVVERNQLVERLQVVIFQETIALGTTVVVDAVLVQLHARTVEDLDIIPQCAPQ